MTTPSPTTTELRRFGLTVGGLLVLLAFFPWVRAAVGWALHAHPFRSILFLLGAGLVTGGIWWPHRLQRPHHWWMGLSGFLGRASTRVVLGLLYYGLLTPVAFVKRWQGDDFLGLTFRPDLSSYRQEVVKRPASHLDNQY